MPRLRILATGLSLSAFLVPAALTAQPPEGFPPPAQLQLDVRNVFPHDTGAFTQGLQWHGGLLYESTGQYGESDIRKYDPFTGAIEAETPLPADHFGEGLTIAGDRALQITWREGVCHIYDAETLEKTGEFTYDGEGWGLTFDGERLIMSDGSDRLTFRDPETFRVLGTQQVIASGRPVPRLNELEYVDGVVWANVFMTDFIVRIDPNTGIVTGVVNAAGLLTDDQKRGADVLNGIAWNPETETFWITGKYWPSVFEARFVDPNAPAETEEMAGEREDTNPSEDEQPPATAAPTEAE